MKTIININPRLLILILVLNLVSCSKFGPEQEQAWKLINQGALIIDVRTKEEYKQGHLNKAINIPYENIPKIIQRIGKDKNKPVVLYCRSGRRASVTLNELQRLGYKNIINGGGLNAMKAAFDAKKNTNSAKP